MVHGLYEADLACFSNLSVEGTRMAEGLCGFLSISGQQQFVSLQTLLPYDLSTRTALPIAVNCK